MAPKKKSATSKSDVDPDNSMGQSTSETDAEVIAELKSLYKEKLLPIERACQFHKFNQPEILDSELAAKPTVLLIGQYSTGKTTFIRNLIGMDYPEIHIGPEPTTDRFIAVVHGNEAKTIKGNALTGVNELPFSGLSTFGTSFLNKFSAAVVPAPLLKDINIIDTPGVLSGEKQRTARGYDFAKVSRWFAERSDLILLLFDCSKLDISDEFRSVIEELQPHEDKVHCVLNKADQLDQESLMRVYGALLWSMGRIFKGAEVARIYVGSFHDEPLAREEHRALFEKDRQVLMGHLEQLPRACSMRKVNEMVKRLRRAVVHVCIMGHLRSKMPYLWGKEKAQLRLIEQLDSVFAEVRRTYQLAEGDFPRIDEYRSALALSDMTTFPAIDRHVLNTLQDMLLKDVPKITALIAGVGSAPAHGKNKKSSEDDEGDSDRLPQMFTFSDDAEGHKGSKMMVVALVVSVVVALLALFMASVMDDHKSLLAFSADLKRVLQDLHKGNAVAAK
jgi:GTPase SAR1 family protein